MQRRGTPYNAIERLPRRKADQFNKVFNDRKERVHGLWERKGVFYAQLDANNGRQYKYPLQHAATVPQAVTEMQALKKIQRDLQFVFGNVAYSIGIGGGIVGALKSMARGEVPQFTEIFNTTRHLALQRITAEARNAGANAVVGVRTSIIPFRGMQEMVMIGTASRHPALPAQADQAPVTSDLTNEEMWNVVHMGFMPLKLVLGTAVYSLGVIGGIKAMLKGFARGEIPELTSLIYEAREKAIERIKTEAAAVGADDVVGIKTYVYQLGGGTIEFMAMGTAVKKMGASRRNHSP